MNYLVNKGIEGLDMTGDMIAHAGTKMQTNLDESEAWNICESVIVHGDELARKT